MNGRSREWSPASRYEDVASRPLGLPPQPHHWYSWQPRCQEAQEHVRHAAWGRITGFLGRFLHDVTYILAGEGTDRCNESGQESRGIFAAGSTEAPDFFSRTADGAPLRAIEARVCSPCAPSPPACAPRSLAGWQAAKTAWAELHQPRRTARTSSADRGRQWRATGSSQPRDGAHSAGVGRSPRHGGARQLPSQDSLRLNCRSRF